ncbi:DsbA family oxidoreductase [Pseudomonas sp. ZM23]|uniref:DsbA family oxidoreductase n=1 Tax=Pseudomonas triclosanedens TaxID=2961893 RepID=A0ABY7A6L0_9PSED|nr:DsbA family oxidoreductase [Pseudomonas triclosanedens]MCP8466466.1 DsbA family oxidoreductase [Pseudomonas triclosanedens]MCP8473132.1 DsbA family oxidoreductase [Pseudomonas triclosanedens]MCP8479009.1 DsbA family oxidoreductase [Pseudomonas triclosanedens]WAI52121.1 DsbA family oxidoreductase [Pseudomonas triclosanedens]
MRDAITIDFVSDVVCPWCAIGLNGLLQAIRRVDGELTVELHIKPFELNTDMPSEGEDLVEHLQRKYGSSAEEIARNQEHLRAMGEEVGVHFDLRKRSRIYNTFDAHRLLHWAAESHRDLALKQALLHAYFGEGRDPSDAEVLLELAVSVGLDAVRAREVLDSDAYGDEVVAEEDFYTSHGIHAVPAVILNGRQLISGAQSVDYYEQALRQVARQAPLPE